jgi:hypothetical protein
MREDQKQQAFPDDGNFGISIRDYFAARAMQGMFSNSELTTVINSHDQFAELSYRMADAMLRAREHDTR